MSKTYFKADVDEEIIKQLVEVFNIPLMDKTENQHLLKNTLLTQIGIVVLAQYTDITNVD